MSYFPSVRRVIFSIFLAGIFSIPTVRSQVFEVDSLDYFWNKAYFSEVAGDTAGVISNYRKVMEFCESEPLDVREWFKGVSLFGIARAYAMENDKISTRVYLGKALARHFWNFHVIRLIGVFDSVCGTAWIDSACGYWSAIRDKEMPLWHNQPSYVLKPKSIVKEKKYPLVIALAGGNDSYQRLVKRLGKLPDSLGVVVIIPAAVHRLSEVSDSWDDDTAAAASKISALIDEVSRDPMIDTKNISLLGFSQGAQISYEYGFSHPDRISHIIAFSGFAPPFVAEDALAKASEYHMSVIAISGPTDSPDFLESTAKLQRDAVNKGLRFTLKIENDLPHGFPVDMAGYCVKLWDELRAGTKNTSHENGYSGSAKPDEARMVNSRGHK